VSGRRGMAIWLTVGLAFGAACLWWSLRRVPWQDLDVEFRRARYWLLPPFLGLLAVFYWLKAVRWRLLLLPLKPMSTRDVAGPLMVGFMANNLFPAHLGEFIRVFVIGRTQRISRSAVFSSVVLERLFDMVAILMWLGIGLMAGGGLQPEYRQAAVLVALTTVLLLSAAGAYVVWPERFVTMLDRVLRWWFPPTWRKRLVDMLRSGVDGMQVLRRPRLAAGVVVTSLLQWLVMALMAWVSLWAFGQQEQWAASFVVVGVIAVAILAPAPPGYVGFIQALFVAVLGLYGVREPVALAASVFFHVGQFVPVTLVGLWYLKRMGLSLREVRAAGDDVSPESSGAG